IYLASGFYGLVDFDPGPQVFNLQSDTANASWYMLRMHLCDDFAASPGTINIPPLCIGDTVILSVAQGGPQYLWEFSPGFTPVGSVAGDSVIVVVDSNAVQVTIWVNSIDGCMNSPLVYSVTDVHQPVVPVIIFNSFGDTLLTQVPALYYQWYQDGIPVLNANDSAFYPMAPAYYSVMTIDSNGCEALSDSLLFLPEGLDDFQTNLIHVYPNPFTDIITLSHAEKGNTIRIKNYSGQTLLQQQTNDFSTAIDGTIMSAGIYFIEYQNKEKTYYCKLVKISDPK
ncbi:MAG TPA: T9SS type A sorting domain-containing protein, partial [Bacteroidia bacterium]|nr:T9SS type A sorting domain-containing protein [Bacteroidia bacterium]